MGFKQFALKGLLRMMTGVPAEIAFLGVRPTRAAKCGLNRGCSFALRVGVVCLALAFVVGCAENQKLIQARDQARQRAATAKTPVSTDYVLGSGDDLTVKFFYNPELNEQTPIRPDGKIALALVGDVQAAGRTVADLRNHLMRHYEPTLKYPEITVIVNKVQSQKVYVGGEVGRPGVLELEPGMTAMQAIIKAGGDRDTAEMRNVVIIRDQGTERPQLLMVDLHGPLAMLDRYEDVSLAPLDIVIVPKSEIAKANQFVEQYIDKLVPVSLGLGVTYNLGEVNSR